VFTARIRLRFAGLPRCAWCHDSGDIAPNSWGSCPTDHTVLHLSCLDEFGECPVCREDLSLEDARCALAIQRTAIQVRVKHVHFSEQELVKISKEWERLLPRKVPRLLAPRLIVAASLALLVPALGPCGGIPILAVIGCLATSPLRRWWAWRSTGALSRAASLVEVASQLQATARVLLEAQREVRALRAQHGGGLRGTQVSGRIAHTTALHAAQDRVARTSRRLQRLKKEVKRHRRRIPRS
jgi:hypothetical protein